MEKKINYILFPNHTEGMKLHMALSESKIKNTIVPTPRELSVCCGMAIMYEAEDEEKIKKLIAIKGISIIGMHSIKKNIKNYYLD